MKHRNFSVTIITMIFILAATPMTASAVEEDVDNVKRDLDNLIKKHGNKTVEKALIDIGVAFPGSSGFRGMLYSEYLLKRNCWDRGPQAGLIRNDNCITYKSKCGNNAGGSKVTVTRPNGDKFNRTFAKNRELFVCEATIHLPQEEPLVIGPATPTGPVIRP
jgi:hypothetical protein